MSCRWGLGMVGLLLVAGCGQEPSPPEKAREKVQRAEGEDCAKGQCMPGLACVGRRDPQGGHGLRAKGEDDIYDRKPRPGEQTCQKCESREKCDARTGWCWCDMPTEGCPCGCDRSQTMAAELRARGDASARYEADRSLRIIRDREERGYITEAMVQHRLRLSSLRETWGSPPAVAALSPAAAWRRASREALPAVETSTLRARGRLLVHAEATEWVRGAPKRVRSSFRLWLGLENRTREPLQLSVPQLLSAAPELPVSRWYLEDTVGEPFPGRLAPEETVSVLVIGYAAAPIAPGDHVVATVQVGDAVLPLDALAAGHWTEL